MTLWLSIQLVVLLAPRLMLTQGIGTFLGPGFRLADPALVRTEIMTGRKIFELHSYRDGQLFRFHVPLDTKEATWKFNANYSEGCHPSPVSLYLEPGSYPVLSPDGGRFPDHMSEPLHAHNLTFRPENGRHSLTVKSPAPGDWYLLAFLNKQTKKDFVQKVLDSRCSTWLHTDVEYQLESNVIQLFPEKHNHQKLLLYHNIAEPQTYRFYTGKNVWSARLNITKCRIKVSEELRGRTAPHEDEDCPIRISVAPRRPPDIHDPRYRPHDCNDPDQRRNPFFLPDTCYLELYPEEESWHYITITPRRPDRIVEFAIGIVITDCPVPEERINYLLVNKIDPHQICSGVTKNSRSAIQLLFPPYQPLSDLAHSPVRKCGQRIHLVRKTLAGPFTFEYHLPAPRNASKAPFSLDLENNLPSVLQFTVGPNDIGGTLAVEIGFNFAKMGSLNSGNSAMIVRACLNHGRRMIPFLSDGHPERVLMSNDDGRLMSKEQEWAEQEAALCPSGRLLMLNSSIVSDKGQSHARVLVPFPAAGDWFLTLLPTCSPWDGRISPSSRQNMLYEPYHAKCGQTNTTPIAFAINSDMCVVGGCGKYGRCYQFFSGGNMFSTCSCFAGYKGWACSDDSDATSEIDLLAATLLLCLSNLIFLPAVGLAIYRGFYTESFIYFANMIFSTLYHACDQDVFSFCLMKYSVLQFCDYYTATMSYWVTILAMGALPDQAKSLLQMVGAVGVALAIEYDRTGLLTFMIPGIVGMLILIASWVAHCSSERRCYPGIKYTCCFFLPGLAVLCGGLFCFLFLEKESNYQFVHSAWHVSMAVSILFLLPQTSAEKEEKYSMLETRPSYLSSSLESSFKHYADSSEMGPEIINVTANLTAASAGGTANPASVVDAPLRNASKLNHLPGGATLPRSNLSARNFAHSHGTMKKGSAHVEELRPLTSHGHYHVEPS